MYQQIERVVAVVVVVSFTQAANTPAKETHFEEVKFKLVSEQIRCTHCHSGREDPELTLYGQKIMEMGKDRPIQARVKDFEAEIAATASDQERNEAKSRIDVDSDGVPNWIEILTGRDPSAKDDESRLADGRPSVDHVMAFVQCTICHIRVDAVAGLGKSRAPHNLFGKTLTEFDSKGRRLRGKAVEQADAEDVEFLQRLDIIAKEDADDDSTPNWDEISTLRSPFDKSDRPTGADTKAMRQRQAERHKNDEGFGQIHKLPAPPRKRQK